MSPGAAAQQSQGRCCPSKALTCTNCTRSSARAAARCGATAALPRRVRSRFQEPLWLLVACSRCMGCCRLPPAANFAMEWQGVGRCCACCHPPAPRRAVAACWPDLASSRRPDRLTLITVTLRLQPWRPHPLHPRVFARLTPRARHVQHLCRPPPIWPPYRMSPAGHRAWSGKWRD